MNPINNEFKIKIKVIPLFNDHGIKIKAFNEDNFNMYELILYNEYVDYEKFTQQLENGEFSFNFVSDEHICLKTNGGINIKMFNCFKKEKNTIIFNKTNQKLKRINENIKGVFKIYLNKHNLCSHRFYQTKDWDDIYSTRVMAHDSMFDPFKLSPIENTTDEFVISFAENNSFGQKGWKLFVEKEESNNPIVFLSGIKSSVWKLIAVGEFFLIQEVQSQLYLTFNPYRFDRDLASNYIFLAPLDETVFWSIMSH